MNNDNDMPKQCRTCKHWNQFVGPEHLGICMNVPYGEEPETKKPFFTMGIMHAITQDISACSKWLKDENVS